MVCQFGFNKWEHPGGGTTHCGTTIITRDQGADFYSCKISIPDDTFQLNMVFTDGEGRYENNGGLDFNLEVSGPAAWR